MIEQTCRGVKFPHSEVTGACVDFLSCSADGAARKETCMARAKLCLEMMEALGCDVKHFKVQDYNGWIAGSFGYGWNDTSCYVRLSGSIAGEHWQLFAPLADRVSRLDLAATVRFKPYRRGIAETMYHEYPQGYRGRGRPPMGTLIMNKGGGQTFLVGKPSSDLLGRVYDKEVESGEPAYIGCYRWEVQDRSRTSLLRCRALLRAPDPGGAILSHVHHYYTKRGVPVPFEGTARPLSEPAPRPRSDDERRLAWLHKQARPSVQALVGRGKLAQVMWALGFDGLHPS